MLACLLAVVCSGGPAGPAGDGMRITRTDGEHCLDQLSSTMPNTLSNIYVDYKRQFTVTTK